jgi:hypothetical protein
MRRARRTEIIRSVRRYAARLVEEAAHGTSGLFEGLDDEDECELARGTARRLAEQIRGIGGDS